MLCHPLSYHKQCVKTADISLVANFSNTMDMQLVFDTSEGLKAYAYHVAEVTTNSDNKLKWHAILLYDVVDTE